MVTPLSRDKLRAGQALGCILCTEEAKPNLVPAHDWPGRPGSFRVPACSKTANPAHTVQVTGGIGLARLLVAAS